MSKAFKCDRCQVCFDPLDMKGAEKITTITEVYTQTKESYTERKVDGREEEVHLCPECSKAFVKFIKNQKYMSPIKTVIHLEDEERKDWYEKGFDSGFEYCAELCNSMLGQHCGGIGKTDSADKASERPKRAKKDGQHRGAV